MVTLGMRKLISLICITLSLLIILGQFNVWDSLLLFMLVGSIPGTSMSLPPAAMLIFITVIIGVATLFIVSQTNATTPSSKKTLPKKRYSRI